MLARRVVAARLGLPAAQRSWSPLILVGVATGAFGYPWAPLPVLTADGSAARTRATSRHR